MSDLISRQAAIDALAKFVPYAICDESTESYTNGLTDAYNLILQLPSAQPYTEAEIQKIQDLEQAEIQKAYELGREEGQKEAQPEQRWIPCSERLPEVNEDGESDYILLSCSNYSLPIIGRYQVDDQGGAFYYGDDDKPLVSYGLFVNAWMPLPEPYKEGQE